MTSTAESARPVAPVRPLVAAAGRWRRWRAVLAASAVVLLGGVIVALLGPGAGAAYLDPAQTGPAGAHALAAILARQGRRVIAAYGPAAASRAAAAAGGTLVITSPEFLSRPQLDQLALAPANVVIVGPDRAVLFALAPGVSLAGRAAAVTPRRPGCALPAARQAGAADLGGTALRLSPGLTGAAACYRAAGQPLLVRLRLGGRVVTIAGGGDFLTNSRLADQGNAALALNLLRSRRIIWLVPPVTAAALPPGLRSGRASLFSLIPAGAYLVAAQLAIAALLAALWRGRRLGALISEPLPVVVRATETVEGHGRLYQARRARDRAAGALRAAALARLLPAAALPPGTPEPIVTSTLAARSGLSGHDVEARLFGPVPPGDRALVSLADDLDSLEKEVRGQ